ncbi:MAG: 3-isopropylmalate dehydratase small subunit [Pyramidobacter sp.]|nr:3-isopropylmalate dehydratase small subunit [Pyramidobacter sp.]
MLISGKALKYGDDINTDLIIAGKYTKTLDFKSLADHVMEDLDSDFRKKLSPGDFVVGGENFGCGSSREQAPVALKHVGVGCVIAKSFARIFFRNAINIGLPLIECDTDMIQDGDRLECRLGSSVILNVTQNKEISIEPLPTVMVRILAEGGLVAYMKKHAGYEDIL